MIKHGLDHKVKKVQKGKISARAGNVLDDDSSSTNKPQPKMKKAKKKYCAIAKNNPCPIPVHKRHKWVE